MPDTETNRSIEKIMERNDWVEKGLPGAHKKLEQRSMATIVEWGNVVQKSERVKVSGRYEVQESWLRPMWL